MGKIIKPSVTLANIQEFFNPILKVKKYEENYKEAKIKNVVAIILSFIFAGVITCIISVLCKIPAYYKYFVTIIDFAMFSCIFLYFTYVKPDRISQVCDKIKADFPLMDNYKSYVCDSDIIEFLLETKYFDEEWEESYDYLYLIKEIFPYAQTVVNLENSSDSSLYEIKEDKMDGWFHDKDTEHTLTISEKIDSREYRDFKITTFNREDYSGAINLDFRYIDKRFEEMRKSWAESH